MSGRIAEVLRRRPDLRALAVIVAVAGLVRFIGLGADPLWIDEMRAYFGQSGLPLLREIRETFGPIDPPLSFVVLNAMGHLPISLETALRLVPAVAGVGEVVGVWGLLRVTVPQWRSAALLAAAAMALAPFGVRYSQEARYYTLASALQLAGIIAAVLLARTGSRRAWIAWVVISLATVYTHVLGWYWFGLQVLVLGVLAAAPRLRKGSLRPPGIRAVFAAVAVVVVGFLPWAAYSGAYWLSGAARGNDPHVGAPGGPQPEFTADFLIRLAFGLVDDARPGFDLLVGLALASALAAPLVCRGSARRVALALWIYLLSTAFAVSMMYRVAGTYFAVRRYEFLLPVLLACAALGLVGLHRRLTEHWHVRRVFADTVVGGLVAAVLLASAAGTVRDLARDKPDYRAVARAINASPDDTVIVIGSFSNGPKVAWDPVLRKYLAELGVHRTMASVRDLAMADVPDSAAVLWVTGAPTADRRFAVERLNDVGELLPISGDASYGSVVTPVYLLRSQYRDARQLSEQARLVEGLSYITRVAD